MVAVRYCDPMAAPRHDRSPRRFARWSALLIGWSVCCAAVLALRADARTDASPPPPAHCPDDSTLDATLFLVGDAGAPRLPREPLLDALAAAASERVDRLGRERVGIALLGDNIYPAGLRAPEHPDSAEDRRRLLAQLDAIERSGAQGFLVPGNHDWSNGAHDGEAAIVRQTRFVADRGARELPPDGCPGPVTTTLGRSFELIFLDTQWWLHDGPRPVSVSPDCPNVEAAAVESALADALRASPERHSIVLAHHPLRSGGPHGGVFGWREHLFPLREFDRSLWIPIPVLGSIRHVARRLGASPQDAASEIHRSMVRSIERGLAAKPPLLFAAGHDHSLQVIRGGDEARFHLISGAGSANALTWAYPVEGTLFAAAESGFARLDAFAGGAVELTVLRVDDRGAQSEAYSACLASERPVP